MLSIEKSSQLKGIAILFVIIAHIVGAFGIRYATPLGGIGVSIFLFLSGYGLSESYKKNGISNFIEKRISKVYIPYAIIVLIDSIIQNNNIYAIGMNLLLISTPNFMWFIQFITLYYLIFFGVNKIIKKVNIKYFIWIVSCIIVFLLGNGLWSEQAFIFFLGVLVSENKQFITNINTKYNLYIGIIFIMIGCISLVIKQLSIIRNSPDIIYKFVELILKNTTSIGIIMTSIYTTFKYSTIKKLLMKLSTISYEVFLVHAIIFSIVTENTNFIGISIFLTITLLGSILLKYISNKLILLFERCLIKSKISI